MTFDQTNNGLYMAEYVRCGEDSNLVPVPAGPDAAANIPGSCTAAPAAAQRLPESAGTTLLPHSGGAATNTAVQPVATKMDPEYTAEYTPVPRTGLSTTATANRQAHPAASTSSSSPAAEDCDENGQKKQNGAASSTAVRTVTNTVVRHVAYTADGRPTTQLETVKMISTVSAAAADSSDVLPSTTRVVGPSGAARHATPAVVTQKVEMYHTATTPAAERYMSRLGGTGGLRAPQGPGGSPSSMTAASSESQSQYQVLSHAMPSPSPPPPASPQSVAIGAGAGAGVAFGGMGWGFNTSNSNNNNNNYGGNSNGNTNSVGTAAAGVPGVAAPTRGPIGPVVVPAPAPTPAPVVPMRPTATHSGFIIGTSGAADGLRVSKLGAWMIAVFGSTLALVVY